MTVSIVRPKKSVSQLTADYLAAREAADEAKKVLAAAEAAMKESFVKAGVTQSIVGDIKVAVVEGKRAKYDTETLATLVDGETFATVTKTEVDGTLFKSAVAIGVITPEVADEVTTYTVYEQIRVNQVG